MADRLKTRDPGVVDERAALVDLGRPDALLVTGNDRIGFLQRLLTGNVIGAPVGGGGRSLLLNIKGHVVSDLRLFVRPDSVRVLVAAGQGTATAAALSRYAIMDDVTIVTEEGFAVHALLGPGAVQALHAAQLPVPPDFASAPVYSHVQVADLWVARLGGLGVAGVWLGGATQALESALDRLAAAGVPTMEPDVTEAMRIAVGDPKFGAEIREDYFPMELALDAAIDYSKGCYLGQEPIVRIRDRGHVNYRLVGLRFPADRLPSPGDRLQTDEKPKAGRITSVARFERPGAPAQGVALAMAHVSVPLGGQVRLVGDAADADPAATLLATVVEAHPGD